MSQGDEARSRANRQGEIDSAAVYRAMATVETKPQLASVDERLAMVEERHLGMAGSHWAPEHAN